MTRITLALLAGTICGLAISAGQAAAKQIAPVQFVAPWYGGAFANDQTGQFTSCIASANYNSGITMTVMIGRNGGWFLGFGDPAWNLGVGTDIPVSMTFDGQAPWSGAAHALTAQMVDVPMAENSALITAFRAAYQMQVYAEGRSFAFNLNGTSRLMVQLAHCVQTALAIERGVAPPHYAEAPERPLNPPAPPISTNGPPQDASLELEATRIASNLLLQANLPHAHLLSNADTPPQIRGHGVAWLSDEGLGAVEIVSATAAKDAGQVASELVASDSAGCKGDFASGRSNELLDDKVITKAFTGCKDSSGTHTYRYFILRATNSDFIVYALTGSGTSTASKDDTSTSDAGFQAAAVKAAFSK